MQLELSTQRLSLRPLRLDSLAALHSLWTAENVRRYLWDGEVIPLEQTREILEKNCELFEQAGFGIWGVREHGSDALLGFTGYWHFRTPPSLELLFGVAAEQWSRGIASESSRCVIRYGFEQLDFQRVDASTDAANTASVRVLEALGMVRDRRELLEGLDTIFYRQTRNDWTDASEQAR
ncbi:MAG: GNAT family protein [Planctomycetota bacterium]